MSDKKSVCVVLGCLNMRRWNEFQIYMVDWGSASASSDEYSHIKPTLRLESAYPWVAFCGLNSTLYMFGGHDGARVCGGRSCATKFKITPEILAQSDYKLGNDNLVTLESMRRTKFFPTALPTPDGKSILVFSSRIDRRYSDSGSDFELYNVDDDSWEMLPPPFPSRRDPYSIDAYGFKTESHFVVQVQQEISFLDLSQDFKVWKPWFPGNPQLRGYFIGIDDRFLFNVERVYDCLYDVEGALPLSSFPRDEPPDPDSRIDSCVTLLDDHGGGGGVYRTCLVRGEQECPEDESKDEVRVIMDICSTNIQKYKTDVESYKRDKKLQGTEEDGGGVVYDTCMVQGEKCAKDEFPLIMDISSPSIWKYNTDVMSHKSDFYGSYMEDDEDEWPLLGITGIKKLKLMVDLDSSDLLHIKMFLFSI